MVGLDSLCSLWLGHLPSLASPARFTLSHGFIECYTQVQKLTLAYRECSYAEELFTTLVLSL